MGEQTAEDLGISVVANPGAQKQARIRAMMEKKYQEQEPYRKVIDAAVEKIVSKASLELQELIDLIDSMITIEVLRNEDGQIYDSNIRSNVSDETIDLLCIKLASLGTYVQQQVDRKSMDADIAEHMRNLRVAEELAKNTGAEVANRLPDGTTRLKQAQREAEAEEWVLLIKRNAYQSMRHLLDRSERLYEALKKVIDRRRDEYRWGGKS